jgi:hypothetical protein
MPGTRIHDQLAVAYVLCRPLEDLWGVDAVPLASDHQRRRGDLTEPRTEIERVLGVGEGHHVGGLPGSDQRVQQPHQRRQQASAHGRLNLERRQKLSAAPSGCRRLHVAQLRFFRRRSESVTGTSQNQPSNNLRMVGGQLECHRASRGDPQQVHSGAELGPDRLGVLPGNVGHRRIDRQTRCAADREHPVAPCQRSQQPDLEPALQADWIGVHRHESTQHEQRLTRTKGEVGHPVQQRAPAYLEAAGHLVILPCAFGASRWLKSAQLTSRTLVSRLDAPNVGLGVAPCLTAREG